MRRGYSNFRLQKDADSPAKQPFFRLVRLAALMAAAPLAGCDSVLNPVGPVGAAEKLILIDSVAIMLAIVIPVIVAVAAFAFWFRESNRHAFYWPWL